MTTPLNASHFAGAPVQRVAAVVVSHGQAEEVRALLPALEPQVDEVVVVANLPRSAPEGVRAIENERPRGFAANANAGIAATSAELVLIANPDAVPDPGAVPALREFMEAHPRCGVAGPRMLYPNGTWQPSRRRFLTRRTLWHWRGILRFVRKHPERLRALR